MAIQPLPKAHIAWVRRYLIRQILLTVIKRLEKNFIKPSKPYETTGQINQVCFAEGLVNFKNKWFLYYGTADSKIAVAVK